MLYPITISPKILLRMSTLTYARLFYKLYKHVKC